MFHKTTSINSHHDTSCHPFLYFSYNIILLKNYNKTTKSINKIKCILHLMKKKKTTKLQQKLCNNNKSNKVSFSLIIQPKPTSMEKPLVIILNYKWE